VRYLVQGDDEVEDIAQEALLTMLRSLATYRGEGAFNAWLGQLVARTTFKYVRRRRALRKLAEPDGDASLDDASFELGRGDKFFERRRLVALLDTLPHEQRQALVLHYVVEMSVPEIAAELDAPLETIRSRLRVGRARLRALIATESEETP
jgi:RNA polymerase sigma-70 factor (ECF subfamily)